MAILYVTYWTSVANGVPQNYLSNEEVDYSGGEANSLTIPGGDSEPIIAELYTDADCHWEHGAAGAVSTSSRFLAQGERIFYPVLAGGVISAVAS